eukprot:CAMPEP_0197662040 /NCGR_PEP_ID=MMETSP1338-20131121/51937_1 /TAXON_ID=43686 ORGANISM="Pelagodinium beii, Strain RCC1491" /NCGR_SAMPLE_ID=MMETSP1338 /ASSEMBLY_ACC=CAM_ASM_000754 /LENGTH=382 /DNA_ID=CAMNT_0043239721 /DNA_START=58 /DNA_END=1206 /DNA_ORIENTATION=+
MSQLTSPADAVEETHRKPLADVVAEAKMKPVKFPWEADDSLWVMGEIGDSLLKRLRERNRTENDRFLDKHHETEAPNEVSVLRRGRCMAEGSRCQKLDPVVWVPMSLADNLEIANELKAAAKKALEESEPEVVHGVKPFDLYVHIEEPVPNGAPLFSAEYGGGHAISFKLRDDRWKREREAAGVEGLRAVNSKLDRLQFACNSKLLPPLAEWCDQYRSVKAKQAMEKAYAEVEAKSLLSMHRARILGARFGKDQLSDEECQEIASKEAKEAADAVDKQIDGPAEICRCGYHEVWHESKYGHENALVKAKDEPLQSTVHRPPGVDDFSPLDAAPPPPMLQVSKAGHGSALMSVASRPLVRTKAGSAVLSGGKLVRAGSSVISG